MTRTILTSDWSISEGQKSKKQMEDWLHRRTGKIETSDMVASMNKKRKVDFN